MSHAHSNFFCMLRWTMLKHVYKQGPNYLSAVKLLPDRLVGLRKLLCNAATKLLSTAAQVEVMQRELKGLQPILARTSQEVEDMMVVITNDKKEAGVSVGHKTSTIA
eukprot:1139524-Pelagomonas_calceolata.AAC.26